MTSDSYFFVQEPPATGTLRELVEQVSQPSTSAQLLAPPNAKWAAAIIDDRLSHQSSVKSILAQVFSALEFMHDEHLVHLNVTADSVLLFAGPRDGASSSFKAKLTDFGMMRQKGQMVKKIDDQWAINYQ